MLAAFSQVFMGPPEKRTLDKRLEEKELNEWLESLRGGVR
jgi:hypothetical protein